MRRHSGDATWQNLAALGHKFFQQIGILVIDRFDSDVDAAARHRAIGAAESGTAFGGFWLHRQLLRFAVEGVLLQKRIVFLFLEPVRRLGAFLIARSHVARRGFAQRLRFRAFESNDFLGHKLLLGVGRRGRGLFFFAFPIFIGQTEE